jgi:beta-lactamase class A
MARERKATVATRGRKMNGRPSITSDSLNRPRFIALLAGPLIGAATCSRDAHGCVADATNVGTQAPHLGYSMLAERYEIEARSMALFPDEVLPAGSTIKLLIAIATIEQRRSITESAQARESAVDRQLWEMVQSSDNNSANALIRRVTIPTINDVARRIGLIVTRVHGYFIASPDPVKPHTFTTARECIAMLRYILRRRRTAEPTEVRAGYEYLLEAMIAQSDRRFFPAAVAPGNVVANKTGEIHGELNDMAIVAPGSENPLLLALLVHGNFSILGDRLSYDAAVLEASTLARCLYREASSSL